MTALLAETLARISPANAEAAGAARLALDGKAKPPRSLGRLEELAVRLAGIRGDPSPGELESVLVLAVADHGVAVEGVSAYPQAVTRQMLAVFASGRAAANVLARVVGLRIVLVDAGVLEPVEHPAVRSVRLGSGTANLAVGPAMTREEAARAIEAGIELADELAGDGAGLVALGEMGIANTTAASALCAALLPAEPEIVCGRGTGLDDAGLARKIEVVRRGLRANPEAGGDALGALAALGGFEIAVLVGVALGSAAHRIPVVLDGFITGAAALVAARLAPAVADSFVASHRSPEPGHALVLAELGLAPLLDLELRLGEGSGAALAVPLCRASLAVLADMATLEEIGVASGSA